MNDHAAPTGSVAEAFGAILTPTDHLGVTEQGELRIEDCTASELLRAHGSPLYVISEATLRANYRRIYKAFSEAWPAPVEILYAIKANNNFAVRAILHDEGAGSDCFGTAEMYATFMGGADPAKVVVNGSNKTDQELAKAVELGITVNIDSEHEIDALDALAAAAGKRVSVNIRLKILPPEYRREGSDYFGLGADLHDYLRREKWGFSPEATATLIRRIAERQHLRLTGFNLHVGRVSPEPRMYALWAAETARVVLSLRDKTGFAPAILDIGGGWARERDPESRSLRLNPHQIEDYARAVAEAMAPAFRRAGMALPQLWLEVGRYLAGNAACLLGTVGAIKRDCGLVWVNLDCSTNNLMRVDTAASRYHVFPASAMSRRFAEQAQVVGPTCIDSCFAADHWLPRLERGEPVAILDAGMYAETTSTQFNGMARPATVLVSGAAHEVIKERERQQDVFALYRLPERLRLRPSNRP